MGNQTAQAFGPPLIGQTERALGAILARELEGSALSPSSWVLLRLAGAGAGKTGRRELVDRAGSVSQLGRREAEAEIGSLIEAGVIEDEAGELLVTAEARTLQGTVDSAIRSVTARLWGDLPQGDLDAAGRVLGTVLSRAHEELGHPA